MVGAMKCTDLPWILFRSCRRLTRLSSVPTSQRVPGADALMVLMMNSVEPDVMGFLAHLERRLRVGDHLPVRVLGEELVDVLGLKALVHGAKALPQDEPGVADLPGREPAHGLGEVPHHHLLQGDAHAVTGIAPQVLVGEEQDLVAPRQGPVQDVARVGGGADDAAVAPAKGLQVGGRIDIGDGRDLLVGLEHFGQLAPGPLHVGQVGHVRHGAAGGQVRQDRHLLRARQDIGHLGHEVHAAKDDIVGLGLGGMARQLEGVPRHVRVAVDLFALVVVPEDQQLIPQRPLGRRDARLALGVIQGRKLLSR